MQATGVGRHDGVRVEGGDFCAPRIAMISINSELQTTVSLVSARDDHPEAYTARCTRGNTVTQFDPSSKQQSCYCCSYQQRARMEDLFVCDRFFNPAQSVLFPREHIQSARPTVLRSCWGHVATDKQFTATCSSLHKEGSLRARSVLHVAAGCTG